jgi:hypothetical protein
MARLLLAAACLGSAVFAAPTSAQQFAAPSGGVQLHVGSGDGPFRDGRPRDHRRRGGDTVVLGGFGYSPDWAYYNNRSFAPDSFNDWWHDRPDRSLPRWVSQNVGCERMWWSGGAWRC